jgi:GxxExxY protein
MKDIIFKDESYKIMGACFDVYNILGSGFLEAVYQESLEIELSIEKIPFIAKKELCISYKEYELVQKYIPDIICYEKIILELKAVKKISNEHKAQLFNYLKATGYKLGILVNFGNYPKLEYYRIVL